MTDPDVGKPICTSVLVCEQIYQDRQTGKLLLIGVFNRLAAASFPHRQSLSVFFSLTNGRGKVGVDLQIERDDGESLLTIHGEHNIPGPLTILDHSVQLNGVVFEQPGRYWATVWSEGELLNRRPFDLIQPQRAGEEDEDEQGDDETEPEE